MAVSRPFDGTHGTPPSGNGASSFHLFWDTPRGDWVAAECEWMIEAEPSSSRLHFWAMQASMVGDGPGSAGHLGPQWCPGQRRCVNWGGYGPGGRELDGSTSSLPAPDANPNTRDYPWRTGVVHRLRIERGDPLGGDDSRRRWRGSIADLEAGETTMIRELHAAGDRLDMVMVWSEVFARCDDPPVTVRWGAFTLTDEQGRRVTVDRARVNYQRVADGGCATTDIATDGPWFVQRTGSERLTPQGSSLHLSG